MGSTWGARGGFNNFKTRHLPHSCSPSAGPVSRRRRGSCPSLVAAPFVLRRLWVEALWVLGTQISTLVVIAIKDGVHRSRPSPALVGVLAPLNSPSFPSGHVVQYTMLLGFTFFLLYVLAPRSTLRAIVLWLLVVPIVLVGPSRMYLGQHWLSDVLGGYAVAAVLLLPMCCAYVKWRLDKTRGGARTTG